MIRLFVLLTCLWPNLAISEVTFSDRSNSVSAPHIYDGGWEHFVGGGTAIFDCNADGKLDIFAAGGSEKSHLYENQITQDEWHLRDTGFDPGVHAIGAYPMDFDSDGIMDLFVLRVGENKIFKGVGDCKFADAPRGWGFIPPDRWSTAFSATWEPGNDWPTLAVGNYVDRTNSDGPFGACDVNELYRPSGHAYLERQDLHPGFCALSILFSDWSRSGHADLRLSNDRHYYVVGGSEQMYRLNQERFLDESDGWESISIWGMGIASHDITGDLRPDVYLTSMADQLMQLSTKDGFTAAPYSIGTYAQRPFVGDDGRPSTGWHAVFEDIDNDGRQDLFVTKGNVDQMPSNAMRDPNNLMMQNADGVFHEVADIAGIATTERSRGAGVADLDNDGRLDIVVVNRRAGLEVYQNTTLDTGNWVSITPRQAGPNTFAVGSWIEVRNETNRRQTKEVTIGGGHASGIAGPAHFGLGAHDTAEVRILWPNGTTSNWTTVEMNRRASVWPTRTDEIEIRYSE
ncbi:CRTAC1 family protein [Pseudopelagicola sp. nBUS_19]|uniref:CRTAC1 family protein n=1 Tax=Pseudopelagicola sp. nBUS_19 TaxID=3395316 RepID=UPI003EBFF6F9